jgi:hypothetical protein
LTRHHFCLLSVLQREEICFSIEPSIRYRLVIFLTIKSFTLITLTHLVCFRAVECFLSCRIDFLYVYVMMWSRQHRRHPSLSMLLIWRNRIIIRIRQELFFTHHQSSVSLLLIHHHRPIWLIVFTKIGKASLGRDVEILNF